MAACLNCVPLSADIVDIRGCLIGHIDSETLVKMSAADHKTKLSNGNNGSAFCIAYPLRSPPAYMEPSELIADEMVSPPSNFLASVKGSFELVMPKDGKEIISRMLRTGKISVMMGRNNGKQAPTIPSEDSTIGQYRVGVNRSFDERVSQCHQYWACEESYM